MNYKLVEGHGIYECATFQGFLVSHNELQTCRGPCNPRVCKISVISSVAFGHQGSSNCQKMQKTGKSKKTN